MKGIIYKITCTKTNKVYIGQTIRTMESRFERHLKDAEKSKNPKIHFQRAIKKYGRDFFKIEKIDEAETQQELNEKEKYWIKFYNSVVNGYNTAEGGEGGNTYLGRNKKEMTETAHKISMALTGLNNGMSKQLKCKSVITGEEHHFSTQVEILKFFHIKNKKIIMDRANNLIKSLWRHEWLFAFEDNNFINDYYDDVDSCSRRRGTKVILSKDNIKKEFSSKLLAMNFLGYSMRQSGALLNNAIINGWHISF